MNDLQNNNNNKQHKKFLKQKLKQAQQVKEPWNQIIQTILQQLIDKICKT